MNSRRLRLWLAVLVLFLSLVILLAASLPVPRLSQELPLPPITLPTPEVWMLPNMGGRV